MSSSKNLEYEKTSFLNKSNSAFIEEMYIRFIEKDPNLPESWKKYFETLDDDIQSVIKEIEGPTWQPNKKRINIKTSSKKNVEKFLHTEDFEVEKNHDIIKILSTFFSIGIFFDEKYFDRKFLVMYSDRTFSEDSENHT